MYGKTKVFLKLITDFIALQILCIVSLNSYKVIFSKRKHQVYEFIWGSGVRILCNTIRDWSKSIGGGGVWAGAERGWVMWF